MQICNNNICICISHLLYSVSGNQPCSWRSTILVVFAPMLTKHTSLSSRRSVGCVKCWLKRKDLQEQGWLPLVSILSAILPFSLPLTQLSWCKAGGLIKPGYCSQQASSPRTLLLSWSTGSHSRPVSYSSSPPSKGSPHQTALIKIKTVEPTSRALKGTAPPRPPAIITPCKLSRLPRSAASSLLHREDPS